ncbi:hypothetical protein N288_04040 [Bacillus infantis NRRL B-14911]|uniref:Uncharacterized protein n=1 Tax=Bacillus infantis NRRL B-14911 TaxID=1367477 RepID=U5L818_9BACI|nr:hypothetical protein N288_04040 [Bacillus infantis NRRL B-14911]
MCLFDEGTEAVSSQKASCFSLLFDFLSKIHRSSLFKIRLENNSEYDFT